MGILRTIRALLFTRSAWLSGFVAIGFLASHLLHIYAYHSLSGQMLETWFSKFGLGGAISVTIGIRLSIVFSVIVFLVLQLLFYQATTVANTAVLKWGLGAIGLLVLLSQLSSCSFTRMAYEALLCLIALGSLLIQKGLPTSHTCSPAQRQALWDLLKFVVPLCIGLPVVMGGVGFVSSFYSGEKEILRLQLHRNVYMTGYFYVGAVVFVVYPIARQLLLSKPNW